MRYLNPKKSIIKINDKEYSLIFSLDAIDEIQDKSQLPLTEIIMMLTEGKTRELAVKVLVKFLTGQVIKIENDKLDYYSAVLLNTYINQLKSKEIPGEKKVPQNDDNFEPIDIEYWYYVGHTVLGYPKSEVWEMTLGQLKTEHNEHAKYNGWLKEEKEVSLMSM